MQKTCAGGYTPDTYRTRPAVWAVGLRARSASISTISFSRCLCPACSHAIATCSHICVIPNAQVNGFSDLISSLRDYTAAELLSGDNKYQCESPACLGQKQVINVQAMFFEERHTHLSTCSQEAYRSVMINTLPPVLTFSCQRFDIDRNTWQRVKLTTAFEFPLVIGLPNYLNFSSFLFCFMLYNTYPLTCVIAPRYE